MIPVTHIISRASSFSHHLLDNEQLSHCSSYSEPDSVFQGQVELNALSAEVSGGMSTRHA
jgi:hypothetical protein